MSSIFVFAVISWTRYRMLKFKFIETLSAIWRFHIPAPSKLWYVSPEHRDRWCPHGWILPGIRLAGCWRVDHIVRLNKHVLAKSMKLGVSWASSSICIFINFFDVSIKCTQIPPRAQIYFVQLWTWHPLTLLSCMVSFCQLLSHSSTILLSLVVALKDLVGL